MSSSSELTGRMPAGVERHAILPAAPNDSDPGAGQDPDRVRMPAASVDGPSIHIGRPRVGRAAAVGEVHDGGPQLLVARPAEHGEFALSGLAGRWGCSGERSERVIGGETFAAVADLGEQAGRTDHPGPRQAGEDVPVGMGGEQHGHLLLDLRHLCVERGRSRPGRV